ncbi:MAG: HDOD domain-containing protein [Pseudomonadota bacterium]
MKESENQKIAVLSAKIKSFPSLPSVVNHVLKITADPKSTVEELIRAISPDLALHTAILKISNSAFFGRMRKVSSLKQALMVLGFSEIQNIVLSKAVFNSFKSIRSDSLFPIRKFWEHSFLCGLAAKIISNDLSEESNDFFVAGLIHDIGKLVILMAMPDDFRMIVRQSDPHSLHTIDAEMEIIGATHDRIGSSLLTRWMFPENLVKAVGFHHQPEKAPGNRLFPGIVHTANRLSHMIPFPENKSDSKDMENEFSNIIHTSKLSGLDFSLKMLTRYREELIAGKEQEKDILELFLC